MAKRYNLNFGGIPTSLRILMIKSEAEIHRTTATEGAPVSEEKNPFTCGAATVRIKSMIFQVVAQREKKLRGFLVGPGGETDDQPPATGLGLLRNQETNGCPRPQGPMSLKVTSHENDAWSEHKTPDTWTGRVRMIREGKQRPHLLTPKTTTTWFSETTQ